MNKHGLVIIAIFLGGALGTLFRYFINMQVVDLLFPLGTVMENIAGSFLLGALTAYILVKKVNPIIKEGLGVGFCGGFTTMSTLAADTVFLSTESSMISLVIYITLSLFGGITAAYLGMGLSTVMLKKAVKAGDIE
ncbi:fluoride efflux transporter FluC [Evansella cellulosilytica]|uniref:Fluoride-specific ion channel FluC n=1 Tax=Evansella cellulosilytica (strain ATCC 21833 / DSM 2522 / FERM P-1141 / JCM 9156 / N-4) TaxID=649639 RepID=E6TV03_EVAC2|nr:CrcB family protein [Evansella cellulosilytica]ADU28586.1 Camphor resistance CrcB protein [Evansella cellulosilytica DSM 2522]